MDIENVILRLEGHISSFDKDKNLNSARKAAEAFCRVLLLNSDAPTAKTKAAETKLNFLIDSLNSKELKIPENHLKKIKDDLRRIQTFGNIDSHDNDEVMGKDEISRITSAIDSLINNIFDSRDKIYIDQKIPNGIYEKIHRSITEDENWRCEKILSIVYPNRKYKEYRTKDFELFALEEADSRKIGILFLGRNVSFRKAFEELFKVDTIKELSSLTFLFPVEMSKTTGTPVKNRKENIERISKEFTSRFSTLITVYEFIEDYIWDRCLPEQAKTISNPPDEPYFIDQKLHSDSLEIQSLEFVESLIKNKLEEKKPIYIIFGDGGAGKTTFCDQAVQLINKHQSSGLKKKAILISSYDVPDDISPGLIVDSIESLHALVSDEDSFIEPHTLGLNISSGNILIIIDGLDEIQSKLKEKFFLDKFIESVSQLNDTYLNCSVLIASREIDKEAFERDDVHAFYVKGFSEELIEKYLAKRFKKSEEDKFATRARDYIRELDTNSSVMPLILRLACELATDNNYVQQINFVSKYLKFDQALDKVIFRLMDREIGKQFLGIKTCDQYFEILSDIIFQYSGVASESEFVDLVSIALAGTEHESNQVTHKNYHTSTLLSKKDGSFRVKYDSLEFLIKSRLLTHTINTKTSEQDNNILKILSQDCYRGGVLVKEICKYKQNHTTYEISVIQNQIEILSKKRENIYARKVISALLHIYFEGRNLDRAESSDAILKLFSVERNDTVKFLSICGEFYPLDFEYFDVLDGWFNNYSSLAKSNMPPDKKIFSLSTFVNFDKKDFGKKSLSWNSFDDTCTLCDALIDVIDTASEDKEKRLDNIKNDLNKIFRVGFKSGGFVWKSDSVYKQQCASLKIRVPLNNYIDLLVKEGYLVREHSKSSSGIGYRLSDNRGLEVKDFLTQSIVSEEMDILMQGFLAK